jgi:hypothetical protein
MNLVVRYQSSAFRLKGRMLGENYDIVAGGNTRRYWLQLVNKATFRHLLQFVSHVFLPSPNVQAKLQASSPRQSGITVYYAGL